MLELVTWKRLEKKTKCKGNQKFNHYQLAINFRETRSRLKISWMLISYSLNML